MSSSTSYVIGADCGTQGVRAGLFDLQGRVIRLSRRSYSYALDQRNWATQDPETVWTALLECIQELTLRGGIVAERVVGLGIDATSVTLVACDGNGVPLEHAILWMDKRAVAEAAEVNRSGYLGLHDTGGGVSPEWAIPKVMWLKRQRPQVYDNAVYLVDLVDWLMFRLTGVWKTSLCNLIAEWTYVRDIGGWDPAFLDDMGIGDLTLKIPSDLAEMGEEIGGLQKDLASRLGLRDGLPVTTAGMDSYASGVGLGVTVPNRMALSLGTSSCYIMQSDEPMVASGLFGPMSGPIQKGRWAVQGGQSSASSILEWYNRNMVTEEERRASRNLNLSIYSWLDKRAEALSPGSDGLIAMDSWHGNRTPLRDPLLTGCIWGLALSHTKEHIYRALMESVAYGGRLILDAFHQGGVVPTEIYACGGGASSDLWLRIHADVLGVPVIRGRVREAAALGAGICAAVGAGAFGDLSEAVDSMVGAADVFEPDSSAADVYSRLFELYRETCDSMRSRMHRMNRLMSSERD